jgi:hypothetical protein
MTKNTAFEDFWKQMILLKFAATNTKESRKGTKLRFVLAGIFISPIKRPTRLWVLSGMMHIWWEKEKCLQNKLQLGLFPLLPDM